MATTNQFPRPSLEDIRAQLRSLDDADKEIQLAQRAGIDVAEQVKEATDLRAKLIRIRQAYYPGQT